jgi:hypothetical protein
VKSEKSSRPSSSSSGSSGMRSVVSAPDFSELKMLHESAEKAGVGRKRAFQMVNMNRSQFLWTRKSDFFFMQNISFFSCLQKFLIFSDFSIFTFFCLKNREILMGSNAPSPLQTSWILSIISPMIVRQV